MNEQLDCSLSPEVLSVSTKSLEIVVLAQGNLWRNHNERFEQLPEEIKVIHTGETAWDYEKSFSWTLPLDDP